MGSTVPLWGLHWVDTFHCLVTYVGHYWDCSLLYHLDGDNGTNVVVPLGGHLGLALESLTSPSLGLGLGLSLGFGLGSLLSFILGSLLGLLLALPLGWGERYQCGASTGWTPWSCTGITDQSITWTWTWVVTGFWIHCPAHHLDLDFGYH
jgi:hypothetical protein